MMKPKPYPCSFCGNSPSEKNNVAGKTQAGRVATICETCARDALALFDDLRRNRPVEPVPDSFTVDEEIWRRQTER
jgi:hypothetical protein